jgi:enoyl-CoA hydratase
MPAMAQAPRRTDMSADRGVGMSAEGGKGMSAEGGKGMPAEGGNAAAADGGVSVTTDGPVTVVTIDRPERRNAVDSVAAARLRQAFTAFDADEAASVAILTGKGGAFCAGADLRAMAEGDRRPIPLEGPGPMGPTRLDLSKPVIAAIEGPAVAGGLELALWCDLRVAATDAVLGVFCRRFGVPLCDGGTVRLARLIGQSRAMDLVLTGRAVDGAEAYAIGLVNRLTRPGKALPGAVALAHELAALPQVAMRNDRRSLLDQWGLDEPAALVREAELGRDTVASGEAADGAVRFASGAGRHGTSVGGS